MCRLNGSANHNERICFTPPLVLRICSGVLTFFSYFFFLSFFAVSPPGGGECSQNDDTCPYLRTPRFVISTICREKEGQGGGGWEGGSTAKEENVCCKSLGKRLHNQLQLPGRSVGECGRSFVRWTRLCMLQNGVTPPQNYTV